MKFVVLAEQKQKEIIQLTFENTDFVWAKDFDSFLQEKDADAFFNFMDNACSKNYTTITKPVFINSVDKTLEKIENNGKVLRFNGWQGFIEKPIWEIAGNVDNEIAAILKAIGKTFLATEDIAGLVSARVIAMIINEAYFALEDNVSTKAEIDIAMKLGTNYPFGPFEWAEKIGLENVYNLLQTMALEDIKYTPANALKNELNK
jgi:3-hydroxybutyryl-CoA dehydrogenase